MPTLIKYIGQQLRWPELAATGKQSIWSPGQQEERPDAEALQLLATGFFKNLSGHTPLYGNRVITPDDDREQFDCKVVLEIAVPNGLSTRPSFIAVSPASGNLTLTPTGGATFNGSATPLTRTFANNRLGVAITPNPHDVNDYSVSGV